MNTRDQILHSVRQNPQVPVLILGGGINGIGLLRELAMQGIRCLLIDRADFAAGATSKSSRMIHGGLRYLETREFALVKESLVERNRLLANAAHYVSPLKTTIPLYSRLGGALRSALIFLGCKLRPGARGSLITKFGLMFYDFVTRKDRRTPTHYLTGRDESLRQIPGLNPGIIGTATYWDAKITQAERLCIELIEDAAAASPESAALNYVVPRKVEGNRITLEDLTTGQTVEIQPQIVVNATGAWVDSANAILGVPTQFMGPTKGSHLVVDHPGLYAALGDQMVYYQHADGRVCIVFRFIDKVIMGSTDIPVADPDQAQCDDAEIDYMLSTLQSVFPSLDIGRQHIAFAFCGPRPLPAAKVGGVTAIISRGHTIHPIEPDNATGREFPIICLIGGKWTTFRALAEQTTDLVLARLGHSRTVGTEQTPIGGGADFPPDDLSRSAWIQRVATASGLSDARIATLLERYGTRAEAFAMSTGGHEQPLASLPDYTVEEIRRIARDEALVHLADLIYRRSTIGLLGQATPQARTELASIVGPTLDWSPDRQQQEIAASAPPIIRQ